VELIQRTIAPSTWDVNGGPGTIRYWRPGMALVIRQTSEVHDDVADFLKQLDRTTR
jgi:general secretion pathway protein D